MSAQVPPEPSSTGPPREPLRRQPAAGIAARHGLAWTSLAFWLALAVFTVPVMAQGDQIDFHRPFSRPQYFVYVSSINGQSTDQPVLWPTKPDANGALHDYVAPRTGQDLSGTDVRASFVSGPYRTPAEVCDAHIERKPGVPDVVDRTLVYEAPQELNQQGDYKLFFMCAEYDALPHAAPAQNLTLTVGLACNTDALDSAGQAVCTASVSGAAPNASVRYEWALDGQLQAGVTGEVLDLNGVQPGSHTVTVRAIDSTNHLSSAPASRSFIRAGSAGGSSGRAPAPGSRAGVSRPDNRGPLVAGGALAVAGALVVLAHTLARRRRPRPAGIPAVNSPGTSFGPQSFAPVAAPPRPSSVPESGVRAAVHPPPSSGLESGVPPAVLPRPSSGPESWVPAAVLPRPSSGPESWVPTAKPLDPGAGPAPLEPTAGAALTPAIQQLVDVLNQIPQTQAGGLIPLPTTSVGQLAVNQDGRQKQQSTPQVKVEVIVDPSVRTADDRYGPADVHLWGDTVDMVFATYRVTVEPWDWVLETVDEVRTPSVDWQPAGDVDSGSHPFTVEALTTEEKAKQVLVQRSWNYYQVDRFWHPTNDPYHPYYLQREYGMSLLHDFMDQHTELKSSLREAHPYPAGVAPPGYTPPPYQPNQQSFDAPVQVVIVSGWSMSDHPLLIRARVKGRVKNTTTGEIQPFAEVGVRRITVIGAAPRLEVVADANSTANSKRTYYVPPGAELGFADGTSFIHLEPFLTLFGRLYPGGVEITKRPDYVPDSKIPLDDYLDMKLDEFANDLDRPKNVQGLLLRCRFHLADSAMKRADSAGGEIDRLGWWPGAALIPVPLTIRPTGRAFGAEMLKGDFDWLAAPFYRACQANLVQGIQAEPAKVFLVPSRIELERPSPAELPTVATGADRYTSLLQATVLSAGDTPITGEDIKQDWGAHAVDYWHYRFWYERPRDPWRTDRDEKHPSNRPVDQGIEYDSALELPGSQDWERGGAGLCRVDETGRLVFGSAPGFKYDHHAEFYREIPPSSAPSGILNSPNYYLYGQTCDVQVELATLSEKMPKQLVGGPPDWVTYRGNPIHIAGVDQEYYQITITVVAESGEPLSNAQVVAGPAASPLWAQLVPDQPFSWRETADTWHGDSNLRLTMCDPTDANGQCKVYFLPGRMNPYRVAAVWRSDPTPVPSDDPTQWTFEPESSDDPPRPLSGRGTIKTATVERDFTRDSKFVEITLPFNTKWGLSTLSSQQISAFKVFGVHHFIVAVINMSRATGRVMTLTDAFFAIALGPPWGADVSDENLTLFRTPTPVAWEDFAGCPGQCVQGGVSGGIKAKTWGVAYFDCMLTIPRAIDTTSTGMGIPGVTLAESTLRLRGRWSYYVPPR